MLQRTDYELKRDKKGRKYALKIDLKTNKKTRINYKVAQKRKRDLIYRRKRQDIEKHLEKEGAGATYKEYRRVLKDEQKKIIKRRKKAGKKVLTDAQLRSQAKKNTIEYRTGVACRYRYAWIYWLTVGKDEKGKIICDTTPVMEAGALKRNGEQDYETMIEVCKDVYNNIVRGVKSGDICNVGEHAVQGGLCVSLYNKSDKSTIDRYEKGEGCGYSFDFAGYEKVR